MSKPSWCAKRFPCDYDKGSSYCLHRECRQKLETRLSTGRKLLEHVMRCLNTQGLLPWTLTQLQEWFKVEKGEHQCTVWNSEGICNICDRVNNQHQ